MSGLAYLLATRRQEEDLLPDSSRLKIRPPKILPSGSITRQMASAYVRVPMV